MRMTNSLTKPRTTAPDRLGMRILRCGRAVRPSLRAGLTLIELVVVLVILVALAGLLVPLLGNFTKDSREQATRTTLANVARAIVGTGGYEQAMRFARDANGVAFGAATGLPWPGQDEVDAGRANHPQLNYLFFAPVEDATSLEPLLDYDPISQTGWRGEWLDASAATSYDLVGLGAAGFLDRYGEQGDLAPLDGWGRPIIIQLPGASPAGRPNARLVSAGPDRILDTPPDVPTPTLLEKSDDLVLYLFREDPFVEP